MDEIEVPNLTPQDQANPEPNKPLGSKKILIIAAIAFAILIAIGVIVYVNTSQKNNGVANTSPLPAPSSEAATKSYSNNTYSLSFNYPEDWELDEQPGQDVSTVAVYDPKSLEKNPAERKGVGVEIYNSFEAYANLLVYFGEKPASLESYLVAYSADNYKPENHQQIQSYKKITLNGQSGYLVTKTGSEYGKFCFLFESNGKFYNIVPFHSIGLAANASLNSINDLPESEKSIMNSLILSQ
jgi:hypothetical protein